MKRKPISSLYPTTKMLFVILMVITSVIYNWKFSYFIILPLCTVFAIIDGEFWGYIKKVALSLVLFVAFIFFFQFLMDQSNSRVIFDLGFIKISEAALLAGLQQTRVLISLVATLMLFFETTEMEDFMISLQNLNVSHVATYVILSTLQLIPEMANKSAVIMQAQQARGIETEGSIVNRMKAFFPSLGPLIISSITDIEDRSVTLEVRGFSSENEKTSLKIVEKTAIDNVLMILICIIFIGLIVWRFMP